MECNIPSNSSPSSQKNYWVPYDVSQLLQRGVQRTPFGLDFRDSQRHETGMLILTDNTLLCLDHGVHLWLDFCLDRIHDNTAASLNHERMQNWRLEYKKDLAPCGHILEERETGEMDQTAEMHARSCQWNPDWFAPRFSQSFCRGFWLWVKDFTAYRSYQEGGTHRALLS